MPFETTLKKLREHGACQDRHEHVDEALGDNYGDDTPIPILKILETNGIDDAHWAMRACDLDKEEKKALGLYLCDITEHVLHVYEKQYPDDSRPRNAILAKRQWLDGEIDDGELCGAIGAAWNAANAAWAIQAVHWTFWINRVAWAARSAAWAAAGAIWTVKAAARAAVSAAGGTGDLARDKEREWQEVKLRKLLEE